MRPKTTLSVLRKDETCRMAVNSSKRRWRMKHRALCVLVFPVKCFVDIKRVRLFWLFTPEPVSGSVGVCIVLVRHLLVGCLQYSM